MNYQLFFLRFLFKSREISFVLASAVHDLKFLATRENQFKY